MALDPRLECLPEHEGPAFRTWQLIMQTTMGKVVQTPSPSGFQFQSPNQTREKALPFVAGDDFIALETQNDSTTLKRKKSASSTESLSSSEADDEDLLPLSSLELKIAPWKKREKYPENAAGLHLEIKDFYDYISPLPEEEAMRHDVVSRITNLITSIWPSAKVEVFGSFRTNLYLPTSDIDLAVFGNWDALPLFTLEKALINKEFAEPSTIKVLDKATVPIIKLTDKKSKIRVDISFNTETSVESAEMVKSYIKEFKILPSLFLTLKHFLVQRDLNEVFTGGIGSYCLMLLTISFLQRHPRVDVRKEKDVNLGVLLMEFFELYGRNFNYQKIGIKVKNGGRYISKDEVAKELSNGEYPALLCIEDPVTLACDIGRSSYGILRVKEAFEYAFNTLDKALRNRKYFKINPGSTYLSRIISIPPDLRAYRKSVKKLYANHSLIHNKASFGNLTNNFRDVSSYANNMRPPLLPTPPSPYSSPINVLKSPHYSPVAFFTNNQPILIPPHSTQNASVSAPPVNQLTSTHSLAPIGCSVVTATGNGFIYHNNSLAQNSLIFSPSVNRTYSPNIQNSTNKTYSKNYYASKDTSQHINSPAVIMNKIFMNSSYSNSRQNNYYMDRDNIKNSTNSSCNNSPQNSPKLQHKGIITQNLDTGTKNHEKKIEDNNCVSSASCISNNTTLNATAENLTSNNDITESECIYTDDSAIELNSSVIITNSNLAMPSVEKDNSVNSKQNEKDSERSVIVISTDEDSEE